MSTLPTPAIAISLFLVSYIFIWFKKRFTYNQQIDNLRGPESPSWVTGNLSQIYSVRALPFYQSIAIDFGNVAMLRGLFGAREVFVADPLALYTIGVKDSSKWTLIPLHYESNKILFGLGIITACGAQHKSQRKLLNSSFSTTQIKSLTPIFWQVAKRLRDAVNNQITKSGELDMLHWTSRGALELIGQSGLGYSFDKLTSDEPNPYANAVKNLLPTTFKLSPVMIFLPLIIKLGTPRFRRWLTYVVPWPTIHRLREMSDIMETTSMKVLNEKRRALESGESMNDQVAGGKDMISVLLRANTEADAREKLTDSELLAQMTSLIFAAMDTTSSALSRTLDLLSQHPDVQEKVRLEVQAATKGRAEDLSYEEILNLKYLDAVVKEALRLHAPVSRIARIATEDNVVPLFKPIMGRNGEMIKEFLAPKGTVVHLGLLAMNTNPDIWGDDAHEFKPERWLSPLKDSVLEARSPGVFSHLMTFWAGSRSCMGFKFAELQMKIVLSLLLSSLRFSPPESKSIVWHMSSIQVPTINDEKVGLPLRVEKL